MQESIIPDAEPEGSVSIDTDAAVLKPAVPLITALSENCRLHADDTGLSTKLVDAANVVALGLNVPAGAFDTYDVENAPEIGLPADHLRKRLHKTRSTGEPDQLALVMDSEHVRLTADRSYEHTETKWTHQFRALDTGSIRKQPDLDGVGGGIDTSAEIDLEVLDDVVDVLDGFVDHIAIIGSGTDLQFRGRSTREEGDETITEKQTDVEMAGVLSDSVDEIRAVYSLQYLDDIVSALKKARIETVELAYGDEYPAFFRFERTRDSQVLYSGEYMLAPRIGGAER